MAVAQSTDAVVEKVADAVPCLIPAHRIAQRVEELAREVSLDYAQKPLVLVGVLHGAFVFMADLVRRLEVPVRCGFVMVSSYGDRTETSGRVTLQFDVTQPVEGAHVLLIDDIVDTGISTAWLLEHLAKQRPASVRLCALLDKPARRRVSVKIDYVGFEVPDRFVVGYGIDHAGRYRELPYVGYLPTEDQAPAV